MAVVVAWQPYSGYIIQNRLRPNCVPPSPFLPLSTDTNICGILSNKGEVDHPYENALVAGDTAHDEISVIAGLMGKGGSSKGRSYEDNMMTNTFNTDNKDMAYILNTFGSIKSVPNAEISYNRQTLNTEKCNILDVWVPGGSFFCPGYNNFIDSATTSYTNFIKELGLLNPLEKNPLLFQQNQPVFKFTALLNYDILLFALYLTTKTDLEKTAEINEINGPNDSPLEKAKKMNIIVMNFFWNCLMDETLHAINNDYVLSHTSAPSGDTWKDYYALAIDKFLRNIDFVDMNIAKSNINFMIWKIKNPFSQDNANYAWGITQGTSATSILQILKQIFCCTPRGAGNSKKVDKTSCSDGLEKLLKSIQFDITRINSNNVSAALHSICKFIGDTSHITFGNLIQIAKNKPGIEELVNRIYISLTDPLNPFVPNSLVPNPLVPVNPDDIKKIKINFWISERPMATRLCLDKQIFEDYSVSISRSTGKIIEELYSSGVFNEKNKEYLLVNFDKLESSKLIIAELLKIFKSLGIDTTENATEGGIGKYLFDLSIQIPKNDVWAIAVKNFNETPQCTKIKNIYKTEYLKNQIDDLKKPELKKSIKKVVEFLETGYGKKDVFLGDITKFVDRRIVLKPIDAEGWIKLQQKYEKNAEGVKEQYNYLTSIVSLLLSYFTINAEMSPIERVELVKECSTDIFKFIEIIGKIYEKVDDINQSITQPISIKKDKINNIESTFYSEASNFIENVVKLKSFIIPEPMVMDAGHGQIGGGIEEIENRGGLGSVDIENPMNSKTQQTKLLKEYIEYQLTKNLKKSIFEQIYDDRKLLEDYVDELTLKPENEKKKPRVDDNVPIPTKWFNGPFLINLNSTRQPVESNFNEEFIIQTVIDYFNNLKLIMKMEEGDIIKPYLYIPDSDIIHDLKFKIFLKARIKTNKVIQYCLIDDINKKYVNQLSLPPIDIVDDYDSEMEIIDVSEDLPRSPSTFLNEEKYYDEIEKKSLNEYLNRNRLKMVSLSSYGNELLNRMSSTPDRSVTPSHSRSVTPSHSRTVTPSPDRRSVSVISSVGPNDIDSFTTIFDNLNPTFLDPTDPAEYEIKNLETRLLSHYKFMYAERYAEKYPGILENYSEHVEMTPVPAIIEPFQPGFGPPGTIFGQPGTGFEPHGPDSGPHGTGFEPHGPDSGQPGTGFEQPGTIFEQPQTIFEQPQTIFVPHGTGFGPTQDMRELSPEPIEPIFRPRAIATRRRNHKPKIIFRPDLLDPFGSPEPAPVSKEERKKREIDVGGKRTRRLRKTKLHKKTRRNKSTPSRAQKSPASKKHKLLKRRKYTKKRKPNKKYIKNLTFIKI